MWKNAKGAMETDFLNRIARGQILVLNASYEPINITSWKRAFVLLLKEKAQIINHRVIRLIEYIKIPFTKLRNNKPTRSAIYARDGHKCQYCGATRKLTIDHVIPKSKGGSDDWDNLVVACSSCNIKKGDKYLEHTGMKLARRPMQPRTHLDVAISQINITEWREYCFLV
jgi:5-methylcytosine-specific restriction endonuclease McrA